MKFIFSTLKKTLFWSYDRGSWQYDVMCVLILAFIFFMPNRFFHSKAQTSAERAATRISVSSEEIGVVAAEQLEHALEAYLSRKLGRTVNVLRVERVTAESGQISYLVTEQ
jgi:hypothetical protein